MSCRKLVIGFVICTPGGTCFADNLEWVGSELLNTSTMCSTRAVGLVSPAYYAHLVAARARCHIQNVDLDLTAVKEGAGSQDVEGAGRDLGDVQVKAVGQDGIPAGGIVLKKVEEGLRGRMYFT